MTWIIKFFNFCAYCNFDFLRNIFSDYRSIITTTYKLRGFVNFIPGRFLKGAIGSLSPNQGIMLSKSGIRVMVAGMITSLLSACIVGVILC